MLRLIMAGLVASGASMRPVVIMLHGSGDTGRGIESWVRSLAPSSSLEAFEWVFPSADVIPYTLAGGQPTSVWYDRVGGFDPRYPEQTPSVEHSSKQILSLIESYVAKGVPSSKIAVGGFSQGGNLAYQVAARYHLAPEATALGAVFGLSCYMADDSRAYDLIAAKVGDQPSGAKWPSTFVAHGDADDFILHPWGRTTFEKLKQAKVDCSFRLVPNARHEMLPNEINELLGFLNAQFDKPARDL